MSKTNRNSIPEIVLPPITVMEDEARRLNALASSSAVLFPRVAHFLARRSVTAMTRPVTFGTWCWCIRTKRTSASIGFRSLRRSALR